MAKMKDLTGQRFGRLVAVEPTGEKRNNKYVWLCKCDCGNEIQVSIGHLTDGCIRSCGCLQKENGVDHYRTLGKKLGGTERMGFVEGTRAQNLSPKKYSNNVSGVRGVHWNASNNKWLARIRFKGECYYLGCYSNLEAAAKVRKEAEERIFGEFLDWYENDYKKRKEEQI